MSLDYLLGLKDRSAWEPRDTGKYIREWRELAALRDHRVSGANAGSMRFSKTQLQ